MSRRTYTLEVMHAVTESDLPSQLRHFVLTLALLADPRTGAAYYGQEHIAQAMGVSDRQVRKYFAELEEAGGPVKVERRRRARRDGSGRGSDEWRLVLSNRNHSSGRDDSSTGTRVPEETGDPATVQPELCDVQPELCDSSTGTPVPGIVLEIVLEDRPSISAAQSAAGSFALESPGSGEPKAPKPKRRSSTPKAEQGEAHRQVTAHYFEAFERKHGRAPAFDGADGTAVKRLLAKLKGDAAEACRRIDNAFGSWRAGSVTIRAIASTPDAFASPEPPRTNGKGPVAQRGVDPEAARAIARNTNPEWLQ